MPLLNRIRLQSLFKLDNRAFCAISSLVKQFGLDAYGVETYQQLVDFSLKKTDLYWDAVAKATLKWNQPFTKVSDCDLQKGEFKWFLDGKLNATVNCLDRHVEGGLSNQTALIWERDEPGTEQRVTYKELLHLTCRMANVLSEHGVKKGDRVALYLPISPLAAATMLACARIGAIHTVVFAGFGFEALASRLNDADVKVVVTADQTMRGGKTVELKNVVDKAVAIAPSVKHVLMSTLTGKPVNTTDKDVDLDNALSHASTEFKPVAMDSEDILFMLYTSGSTGKPKGIAHATAGYLLYAATTHKMVFNWQPGDIFSCVADIGWITGHSYVVYGPLANGATSVLFSSVPSYPDPGRYWEMVQRLKVNQFYAAPTAIRALLSTGDKYVAPYDRSSLKTLGSVGEPINEDAWRWYHDVVGEGKCDLVDTWWQTETGGILISPRPSAPGAKVIPTMAMRPLPGIQPVLLNVESGKEITENNVSGALCMKKPWPGMARTIIGSHKRFLETYYTTYPGYYFSGDGAYRNEDGYYRIGGRIDDVLQIGGQRVGTSEIENAINETEGVAESAVIGKPDPLKGEAVYAFVILKHNVTISHEDLKAKIKSKVRSKIAGYATPQSIIITPALPKNRAAKIMRRLLRKIVNGEFEDLGDTSTLVNPECINDLIHLAKLN